MRVIGTAGHVDHGKSTLVQALTGIDPDRLKEEKDRQMTIDLGFAWMTLPSGEGLGFVDVPGHRDFIENMLAGVGGIDAALLVVAADAGIMPQTREHLAILELLEIDKLIVAITRIDLVQEDEWIDLVEEEISDLLGITRFGDAQVVRVSSVSGEGLAELVELLDLVLESVPPRSSNGKPRLPVDRAFTMSGFGTVVTGTLLDGAFSKGDEVLMLPQGESARIRGLQSHKQTVMIAEPGSRVAANISGIAVESITRGDVLVWRNSDIPTSRIDAQCRVLIDAPVSVRHNASLKFFSGAAQRMARIRVLQKGPIAAGESGWIQIELERPVVVRRGDHFILRQPSPGATLGGGRIADPHPMARHKRMDRQVIDALEQLMSGEPAQVMTAAIAGGKPMRVLEAAEESGLSASEALAVAKQLHDQEKVAILNESKEPSEWIAMSVQAWNDLADLASQTVGAYHKENPSRAGIPEGELRSRLGIEEAEFLNKLVARGIVEKTGNRIRLPGFEVQFSPDQLRAYEKLMQRFAESPYSPPTYHDCTETIGLDMLEGKIEEGRLVKVSESVLFDRKAYEEMRQRVEASLTAKTEITIAEVRDMFGTTRKYALALMEHFDSIGLTYRVGDARRLVRSGPP